LKRALVDRLAGLSYSPSLQDLQLYIVESEDLQFVQSKSQVKYRILQQKQLLSSSTSTIPLTSLLSVDDVRSSSAEEQGDSQKQRRKKQRIYSEPQPYGYCINWQVAVPPSFLDEPALFSDLTFILRINSKITPVKKANTPGGLSSLSFAGSQEVTIAHTGLPQGINAISKDGSSSGKSQKLKNSARDVSYKKKICVSRISGFALYQLTLILLRELSKVCVVPSSLPFPSSDLSEPVLREGETSVLNSVNQTEQRKDGETDKNNEELFSNKEWKEGIKTTAYKELENEFFNHPVFQHWIRSKRGMPFQATHPM
jgi:hypothetical protein